MIYYVALPFVHVEGGLAPGQAVECPAGNASIPRIAAAAASGSCGARAKPAASAAS
jgi:hypothetical protein